MHSINLNRYSNNVNNMYVNFNKKTKALLATMLSSMLMILSVSAQTSATINVRGTILDVAGEPIIGANILIQGTFR